MEYLSHQEQYEVAVRKACHMFKKLQEMPHGSMDNFRYRPPVIPFAPFKVSHFPLAVYHEISWSYCHAAFVDQANNFDMVGFLLILA